MDRERERKREFARSVCALLLEGADGVCAQPSAPSKGCSRRLIVILIILICLERFSAAHGVGKLHQRGRHSRLPTHASMARACRSRAGTPHTLHPAPHTLHPTPYTLHPTPYTLHPTPYTLGAGARGVPALLGLALAAWVGVAAGLDACPAAGGANASSSPPFRCAVATTCTVLAVRSGYAHSCALLSHGGVRCAPVPPCVEHNAPRLRLSVPCSL